MPRKARTPDNPSFSSSRYCGGMRSPALHNWKSHTGKSRILRGFPPFWHTFRVLCPHPACLLYTSKPQVPRGNRTAQNRGRSCASFCCSPGRTLPHCPRVSRIFCTARPESDGSFPHNSGIDTAPHVTAVRHRWDIVSDKLDVYKRQPEAV